MEIFKNVLDKQTISIIMLPMATDTDRKEPAMMNLTAAHVSTSARFACDEYAYECVMAPVWDAQEREAAKAERIAQLVAAISNPASYREACDNFRKASDNLNKLYYSGVCEGDERDVAQAVYWAAEGIEEDAWFYSEERAALISDLNELREYVSNPANSNDEGFWDKADYYSDIYKDVYGHRPDIWWRRW